MAIGMSRRRASCDPQVSDETFPPLAALPDVDSASRGFASHPTVLLPAGASARWKGRAMRLQMIDRVRPSEADRLWAIATLREEGQFLRRAMERCDLALTEDYGMYSIELATFVARLRDPPRLSRWSSTSRRPFRPRWRSWETWP